MSCRIRIMTVNHYQNFALILSADILAMFVKRFTSQFDQLKQLIFKLKAMLKTPRHHHHLTEDEEEEEEDEDYLTRDNFNIHKMIVATTAAGKVWQDNTGNSSYRMVLCILIHKFYNIRCAKSQNLNDSRLVLLLSLPNPLKPVVKSRMKM